jgi:hypothetical protein
MINIGDDCIREIFKYTTNKELILQTIKAKNNYLTTLLLNDYTRKYFYEWCYLYDNDYVIEKLGEPRNYNELLFQIIGKIKVDDYDFIINFTDYRTGLLNDLLVFCADANNIGMFMLFIKKMQDIDPYNFKNYVINYYDIVINKHSNCGILQSYLEYKYHETLTIT